MRSKYKYYENVWRTLGAMTSGSIITYCTLRLMNSNNPSQKQLQNAAEQLSTGNGSWTHNWDSRAPIMAQPAPVKDTGLPVGSNKTVGNPVALRHIVLVRHGEYISSPDGGGHLTERGRQQAKQTGRRLHDLGAQWDHVVTSTLTRAQETAMIVLKQINFDPLKMKRCELLTEGTPCPADPPQSRKLATIQKSLRRDGPRIEAAFRRYFFRASPDQKENSYLLIVGHANVIRYFVCRAMQFPTEAWTRISLKHGSITWLTIWPSGYVTINCLGETGFLPVHQLTHRQPPKSTLKKKYKA